MSSSAQTIATVFEPIFRASPSVSLVLKLFFLNFAISLFVTLTILYLVEIKIIQNKRAFAYLSISTGTFIPIIGSVYVVLVVFLLNRFSGVFHTFTMNVYQELEYVRKKPVSIQAYGMSWADVRLRSSQYKAEERNKALYSVSRGLPREVNLIYNSLVSDNLEELRICAFSMLESQQDYLQKKIHALFKKYEEVIDPYKKALLAKQLALLYWELVYRNLSDKEFRALLLERSYFFASLALEIFAEDTSLLILLSRITNERGLIKESVEYLSKASSFKAPSSKIIPYLAELAFNEKDYSRVRYLGSDVSFRYILKISKIVDYWCKR